MKDTIFCKETNKECFHCKEIIPQNEKYIILKISESSFYYHFSCFFDYLDFLRSYKGQEIYTDINTIIKYTKNQIKEEWEIANELGFANEFAHDINVICRELIKKTLLDSIEKEFLCKEYSKKTILKQCLLCEIKYCHSYPVIVKVKVPYNENVIEYNTE